MIQLTLKAWRVNTNLSREEVASIIGKTERTIYNWENGIQIPDKSNLEKLAEIYHTNSDFIFLGDKSALSVFYRKFVTQENKLNAT